MDSIINILQQKADQINNNPQRATKQLAQEEIDRLFEGSRVVVNSITEDTIFLGTSSSSLANEIRYSQISILETISKTINKKITSLRIRIQQD